MLREGFVTNVESSEALRRLMFLRHAIVPSCIFSIFTSDNFHFEKMKVGFVYIQSERCTHSVPVWSAT